jgi:hypothetical protein
VGGRGLRLRAVTAAVVALLLGASPASAAPPLYNESEDCIRTASASTPLPPAVAGQSFEIRRRPGVSAAVATQIQNDLISRDVQARLNAGLGSNPLGFPDRPIPIFLVPGKFDEDGNQGATSETCELSLVEAIVSRTDYDPQERSSTAAHELFHAYSSGVPPTTGRPTVTWWEEAAATWSEQKVGFNEQSDYDTPWMNIPELALSDRRRTHEYGMWRFVQFLDDHGYIGPVGGAWPLHRDMISGYGTPSVVNQKLQSELASRGTTLADELAMFWGDRLKTQPMHGPPLRPTSLRTVKIKPGTETVVPKAGPLKTWYKSYEAGNDVKRVTFHFQPNGDYPEGGQVWSAPSATESRRMLVDETVSFCVGADNGADLPWPQRGYPITFTNGNIDGNAISSEIEITAQKESVQCGSTPPNPACRILDLAPISSVFGAGRYPFYSSGDGTWRCVFVNNSDEQEVDLILRKEPRTTPINRLRRLFRQALAEGGFREIAPGDVAGIRTEQLEETTVSSVLMLVGRKVIFLNVYHSSEGKAIEAARVVADVA